MSIISHIVSISTSLSAMGIVFSSTSVDVAPSPSEVVVSRLVAAVDIPSHFLLRCLCLIT